MDWRHMHFSFSNPEISRLDYPFMYDYTEYVNDGKQGHLVFDGHFYVNNSADDIECINWRQRLPLKFTMSYCIPDDKPCKKEGEWNYYEIIEKEKCEIEIYKREVIEDTSVFSDEILEEGGPVEQVCFTPSAKQKIYFNVLKTIEKYNKKTGFFMSDDPTRTEPEPHYFGR